MQLAKQSNYIGFNKVSVDNYAQTVDSDLVNIFTAFKGRIRFGKAENGARGENISGECRVFASSSTANLEFSVAHTLGAVPVGFIVINKDKAANLYQGTTSWTSSSVFLKSDVASTTFSIFLLK
jgi:hypothetical protein